MYALSAHQNRFSKRLTVALVALVLAISAAFAAATAAQPGTAVTAQVQKSGAVVITGYDGGVPLAPASGSHP